MNKKELILKLQDIEWEDFEVKEAKSEVPKSVWESVGAFANTAGGWLIFGAKKSAKNFEIIGVQNAEKIEQDFLTVLRGDKFNKKITVQAKKYTIDGKHILGFYIPSVEGKDKPIYFNSVKNTFIRTGSGDQRATQDEIDALYRNSSFDKKDEELTEFTLKNLDEKTVQGYRTYMKNVDPGHRFNKMPLTELMEKLHVIRKGKVTVGGLLVFGDEDTIGSIIGDFRIDYLETAGISYSDAPTKYQYRLSDEKNLFDFYFGIYDRLQKKIDIPFKQDDKWSMGTNDQPQVRAIREALVNLLMHSDYFSNAKPRIRVFSDRIEFFNPGSLPKDIKYIVKEEFSMPRNPTVARVFRHIKLSENIGSGFDKMFNGWTAYYKHKPKVSGDFDYYKIVFSLEPKGSGKTKKQGLGEKVGDTVEKTVEMAVEKTVEKILSFIKANPQITQKELMDKTSLTRRGVEWNLKKLKTEKRIQRIGPDKGGHWEIVQK